MQKLITEISEAIRGSLVGFFKDYQGDFKIDNAVQGVDEEEDEDDDESRGLNGGETVIFLSYITECAYLMRTRNDK